jgi:PPPDE putative peptidase domain
MEELRDDDDIVLNVYRLTPQQQLPSSASTSTSTTTTNTPKSSSFWFDTVLPSVGLGVYHTSIRIDSYIYTFVAGNGIVIAPQRRSSSSSRPPNPNYHHHRTMESSSSQQQQQQPMSFQEDIVLGSSSNLRRPQSTTTTATTKPTSYFFYPSKTTTNRTTMAVIDDLLGVLRDKYFTTTSYHMVYRNCNHFTETFATALVLYDTIITTTTNHNNTNHRNKNTTTFRLETYPKWINRLAKTAAGTSILSRQEDHPNLPPIIPCQVYSEAWDACQTILQQRNPTSSFITMSESKKNPTTSTTTTTTTTKKTLTETQKKLLEKIRKK